MMSKSSLLLWLFLLSAIVSPAAAQDAMEMLPRLEVSENGRFLVQSDGAPFFYLADTAWGLFERTTREDAEFYLETRRQQGFTVIQAVALTELNGLLVGNVYGDTAFVGTDPTQPLTTPGANPDDADEYDYWDHIDWIMNTAAEKGMYIGFLPAWGDKVYPLWSPGPQIFDTEDARTYGTFVGERYQDQTNLIWILGGDRNPIGTDETDYRPVWDAMAEGILAGLGRDGLFTYHPQGYQGGTGQWMHDTPWMDMNTFQSGHEYFDSPVWTWTIDEYNRSPAKPVFDIEPNYEDHPRQRDPALGWFRDHDVRKQSYRSVFAGAHGITYGHHAVWQFYTEGVYIPYYAPDREWREALERPGATHMQHLKNLMLSRPFLTRIPDQSLITSGEGTEGTRVQATRDESGSYAFVYIPTADQTIEVDLSILSGESIRAWWYDPRTGEAEDLGTFANSGSEEFTSPAAGLDAVLVLDDTAQDFVPPGTVRPVSG